MALFYTKDDIRRLTRPHLYARSYPARFQPPRSKREVMYYSSEEHRGYLVPKYRAICEGSIPNFGQQHIIRRTRLLATPTISITTEANKA